MFTITPTNATTILQYYDTTGHGLITKLYLYVKKCFNRVWVLKNMTAFNWGKLLYNVNVMKMINHNLMLLKSTSCELV